jgi:hypothetical protein
LGLGEFSLVHSTYAVGIFVPFLAYAHSLYLDVALAQGVFGLLALLTVLMAALLLGLKTLAHSDRPSPAILAGMLSLAVMMIHGLVDDPLYSVRAIPLLWVPVGLIVAGWRYDSQPRRLSGSRSWIRQSLGVGAVSFIVLFSLCFRPVLAAWYANLGAVGQTRAELSQYGWHHYDSPTLNEIRRDTDLAVAETYFWRALTLAPGQVTARSRLAQIAISRGAYERALEHAEIAWSFGHRDRMTRFALADALIALGRIREGTKVVRELEWAKERLQQQASNRYWVDQDYQCAAYTWRALLILDPDNAGAARAADQAEARTTEQ